MYLVATGRAPRSHGHRWPIGRRTGHRRVVEWRGALGDLIDGPTWGHGQRLDRAAFEPLRVAALGVDGQAYDHCHDTRSQGCASNGANYQLSGPGQGHEQRHDSDKRSDATGHEQRPIGPPLERLGGTLPEKRKRPDRADQEHDRPDNDDEA